MSFEKLTPGAKAPEVFNVVIEISANSAPVKYEVDKDSGCVFVDRFLGTAMHYPVNYGYVPPASIRVTSAGAHLHCHRRGSRS